MDQEWYGLWCSTPLHLAAYRGHDDIVALLIKRGARLTLKSIGVHGRKHAANPPWTPLHLAIFRMNLSTAKLILSHGNRTPMLPRQQRLYPLSKATDYARWFVKYTFDTQVTTETKWTCDKWLAVKGLSINGPDTRGLLKDCHHICLSRVGFYSFRKSRLPAYFFSTRVFLSTSILTSTLTELRVGVICH